MGYTMAQAKRDFHMGYLKGFELERFVLNPGWVVYLSNGAKYDVLVDARSHGIRHFKTLDAAVSALSEIGFEVSRLR